MLAAANKRDFLSGLFFTGVGAVSVWMAQGYRMGRAARMGPGYFPLILSGALVLLGVVISASALRSEASPVPRLAWRPLVVVCLSVAGFGLLISSAGLAVAASALVVSSSFARAGRAWRESLVLALVLTLLSVGIFGYGLGLQFPLWPNLGF